MRFSAMTSVWKGGRFSIAGSNGTGVSCPEDSTCKGRSTEMFRSDTLEKVKSILSRMLSISGFLIILSAEIVGRRFLEQRQEPGLVDALVEGFLDADPLLVDEIHDRVVEGDHALLL